VSTPEGAGARIGELLSAPLEQLLVSLGSGVGRSQAELDRHSIAIQHEILADPQLAQYGVEATWFQIPSTQLELKVAISLTPPGAPTPPPPTTGGAPQPTPVETIASLTERPELPFVGAPPPRMWVAPVTPTYQNLFRYDVQAASTVTLTIVAVPPPATGSAPPTKSVEEVGNAADQYLTKTTAGEPVGRVTVNYNPAARAWFVVQTDETQTPPKLLAFVRVDDATLAVLETRTGS
jgi:hypothetical protein